MSQIELVVEEFPRTAPAHPVEWEGRRYRVTLIERMGAPYFLVEVEASAGRWGEVRFRPTRIRIIHDAGVGIYEPEVRRVRIRGTDRYEGIRR